MTSRKFIYLKHIFWVVLILGGLLVLGGNPRVLVVAFILNYYLTLFTIHLSTRKAYPRRNSSIAKLLLERTRRPRSGSRPYMWHSNGRPAGFVEMLMITTAELVAALFILYLGFQEPYEFPLYVFVEEIVGATGLAVLYWTQDLIHRHIRIDPKASSEENFGYNTTETIVIHLTILFGVVISQMFSPENSLVGFLAYFLMVVFYQGSLLMGDLKDLTAPAASE